MRPSAPTWLGTKTLFCVYNPDSGPEQSGPTRTVRARHFQVRTSNYAGDSDSRCRVFVFCLNPDVSTWVGQLLPMFSSCLELFNANDEYNPGPAPRQRPAVLLLRCHSVHRRATRRGPMVTRRGHWPIAATDIRAERRPDRFSWSAINRAGSTRRWPSRARTAPPAGALRMTCDAPNERESAPRDEMAATSD